MIKLKLYKEVWVQLSSTASIAHHT